MVSSRLRADTTLDPSAPDTQNARLDPKAIDSWLTIREDGRVTIRTGKMELGQGITTAIAQVAAEELNMDIAAIDVHLAETEYTPNEGYTAGSMSIQSSAMSVRKAAASARERLLDLAAQELALAKGSLELQDGLVQGGGKSISIYALLKGKQFAASISSDVPLYATSRRKIVGQSIARMDIKHILTGEPHFIHDLRFPEMVHARIVRPPAHGAKLLAIDDRAIAQLPGLAKLVRVGSLVAVIAEDEYKSITLSEAVAPHLTWKFEKALPVGELLRDHIRSLPTDSKTDKQSEGWSDQVISDSVVRHQASYFKPYIMHAANGPSCAIARYTDGKLSVWTHSQGVYPLRGAIAGLLGLKEELIHIKGVPGAGCYGHNGADDVAAEAALLAMEFPDRHIRLQWMREEENAWEPYGTAMAMELEAALDREGRIQGWKYDLWSDDHGVRPGGDADNLLPAWYIEKGHGAAKSGFRGGATRNAEPYYIIPHMHLRSHIFRGPLRRSSLRGLGAYANVFAIEAFMDELAEKAAADPIEFRLNHLRDSRATDCLRMLQREVRKVNCHDGEGIGVAFARYKNAAAYCAIAAHVSVDSRKGNVTVHKLWAVVDAGEVINPDGLKNQIEGGMVQSISWGLMEEVNFDDTHVTNLTWASYPILRFQEAPAIQIDIIDRPHEAPLGAGEAAQGPATAALVNAIYRAAGIRVRELPIIKALRVTGVGDRSSISHENPINFGQFIFCI
ncbi:xanthine dehydrogenase family protein molybdopterin-binding subunit [Sphingobacterium olei]|uniref:xanthine dehydrogenase family protein molybdopterin-binding subunit n=1 Tax=Sphingobacterium olei TaxID=2571155 RepID=UPI00139047D3|nr:molybdopterin cofactor-binding domain-containing protein [Sphingobacterium olei]